MVQVPPPSALPAEHTVVSANLHLPRSGKLTALHVDSALDAKALHLVSLRLFSAQVGSVYVPCR